MGSEMPFLDKHLGVKVRVLGCHSANSSSMWEKVWGNAEFFAQISCEEAEGPCEFFTKSYPRKKYISMEETFKFVLPQPQYDNAEKDVTASKVQISLFKNGQKLGTEIADVSKLQISVDHKYRFLFAKNQEAFKLDIEIVKQLVVSPDFRFSMTISKEEIEALKRRKQKVLEGMKSFLPSDTKLQNTDEVPTIAMLCSGGGYRSTIQFCGAMEAIRNSGLLNCITYLAGLSGGSWYILPAYAKEALNDVDALLDFHSEIKNAAKSSLIVNSITDIAHYMKYRKYARMKEAEGQPVTFVDYYGYSLARTFLGNEKIDTKLSEISNYAGSGEVPIPIITALHTRPKISSVDFSADMEVTPWEVSIPQYGINAPVRTFGSEWYKGTVVRSCPEFPLHFYLGASSSAFGILLKYYLKGETTEADKDFVKDVRRHEFGKHKTKKVNDSIRSAIATPSRQRTFASLADSSDTDEEVSRRQKSRSSTRRTRRLHSNKSRHLSESTISDIEEMEEERDDGAVNMMQTFRKRTCRFTSVSSEYDTADEDIDRLSKRDLRDNIILEQTHMNGSLPEEKISSNTNNSSNETKDKSEGSGGFRKVLKRLSHHPLFTDREAIIDRTSKVFNIARGLENVTYRNLNPRHKVKRDDDGKQDISTTADILTFVDAAVISNVPCNAVLRRDVDILIVCDATEYKSDTDIDYLELFLAEDLARKHGLKFPKIDPQKIKDDPRGVIHVFEDKRDPECPVVIWFTLCNKEFKALKNVPLPARRRIDDDYKLPQSEIFNVFPVYGPSSPYQTLNTRYSPLQFDRLRELMKYNVSNHTETIKQMICKKIKQKRRKLNA